MMLEIGQDRTIQKSLPTMSQGKDIHDSGISLFVPIQMLTLNCGSIIISFYEYGSTCQFA
jgi:hypothetical protein